MLWALPVTFRLDLCLVSQDRTHAWYHELAQEPMEIRVMGLREEAATVILLNGHSNRLPPSSYLCTHRSMCLSTLLREASFCSRWWSNLEMQQLINMQRIRDWGMLISKCNRYITLLLPTLRNCYGKWGKEIIRVRGRGWLHKVIFSRYKTVGYKHSQQLWLRAQDLCKIEPDKIPAWMGKGSRNPQP